MKIAKSIRSLIAIAGIVMSGLAAAGGKSEPRSSTSNASPFNQEISQTNYDGASSKLSNTQSTGLGDDGGWQDAKSVSALQLDAAKNDVDCITHSMSEVQTIEYSKDDIAELTAGAFRLAMKWIPMLVGDTHFIDGARHRRLMPAASASAQSAPHKRLDFKVTPR